MIDSPQCAGTRARCRISLLQVSDAHLGTARAHVVAALEVLVRAQRPDVLLLSGDITQRATRSQFGAARAFVERLGVPVVLAIPGNHDIPLFNLAARLLWDYTRYAEAFSRELGLHDLAQQDARTCSARVLRAADRPCGDPLLDDDDGAADGSGGPGPVVHCGR